MLVRLPPLRRSLPPMKTNRFFAPVLAALLAVAGFFGIGSARGAVIKGEAVAVTVTGTADYSVDGKDWKPLRANDVLKPGMEVRTATGAKVDLFLNYNGPMVIVQASSHLVLTKLDREEISGRVVTDTE